MYQWYNEKLQAVKATTKTTCIDSNKDRAQGASKTAQVQLFHILPAKKANNGDFKILQVSFYLSTSSTQATSMNKSCLKKKNKNLEIM